jgi:hypothetical protein
MGNVVVVVVTADVGVPGEGSLLHAVANRAEPSRAALAIPRN